MWKCILKKLLRKSCHALMEEKLEKYKCGIVGLILLAIISGCTSTQNQPKNDITGEKHLKTYDGKKFSI